METDAPRNGNFVELVRSLNSNLNDLKEMKSELHLQIEDKFI